MADVQKQSFLIRLKDFFLKTLSGDFDETRKFQKKLQSSIMFSISMVRKFLDDEILLRGASISYAIVVSFVPTLVVVMMLGSRFIDMEGYFEKINEVMRMNGVQFDLEPYFNIIREFLRNAGAIGGIGFLVLLFSATSVLRNVEDAINKIWRVTKKRPMIQKISGFIMVMVFGPALLAVGISFAQSILSQFASPNLNQVRILQDNVHILGDKHVMLVQNEKGKPFRESKFINNIDYEVANESVIFNALTGSIVPQSERELYQSVQKVDKSLLKNATFVDFGKASGREYILASNGVLLVSRDKGATYHARRFFRLDNDRVREVSFRRIQFFTDRVGLIIGSGGLILRTTDSGDSWTPRYQAEVNANLKQVAFVRPGTWAVVGDQSTALITTDSAATFTPFSALKQALRSGKDNLNGLAFENQTGYAVGDAGLFLATRDGGATWKLVPMAETLFFQDIALSPDGAAIAVGYDGLIRYSQKMADGSIQWQTVSEGARSDVDLTAVRYYAKKSRFLIVGDHYEMIMQQHEVGKNSTVKKFETIQKAPFWRRLIAALGNFLIPFIVIFLLFFLLYKVIPYTVVHAKAAATGAAFTSVSWVIFLLMYKFYVTNFSKGTAALYGTLALIPLTLLLLYVSSLIVLFGAELAFMQQYPHLFTAKKKAKLDERHKRQLWYGMSILYQLAESFNKGKNNCTTDFLLKFTSGDQEEFKFIMERLVERGYAIEGENKLWLLGKNPTLIDMNTLVEDLDPSDYSILDYNSKNAFMKSVKGYFDKLQANRNRVFDKVSLADLMRS